MSITIDTVEAREARIAAYEAPLRARAEATRQEALRWHWVSEAWHNDKSPAFARGTPEPSRYWMPETFMLDDIKTLLYDDAPTRHHAGYSPPSTYHRGCRHDRLLNV